MILGGLIDAGVPLDDVRRALGSLAISPDTIWAERVSRAGVMATKFCVRGEERASHQHAMAGSHQHASAGSHQHTPAESHQHATVGSHQHESVHSHRTLHEIYALIDGSALSAAGKERAKALFHRLGEAEAAIHGIPIEQVHLHEVGALDSIIDIVGAVHALETLGADRIMASPLNVGSGSIRSAHGLYPVPAPATARLLRDTPIYAGPQNAELVTPTGALLVTSYAEAFGTIPAMRLRTVGYGAGSRDFADTPNVLRVLIGEADHASAALTVVVIEAEIDDMNPQIFGVVMDQLLAQGALDVFYTPIQMKKNRPGTLLTVIAVPDARERLTTTIFRETTTIGVRYSDTKRECLDRQTTTVETPLGTIHVKVARRNGVVMNASPEFDDCARIARDTGTPLKDVQAAALKAFLDRRVEP